MSLLRRSGRCAPARLPCLAWRGEIQLSAQVNLRLSLARCTGTCGNTSPALPYRNLGRERQVLNIATAQPVQRVSPCALHALNVSGARTLQARYSSKIDCQMGVVVTRTRRMGLQVATIGHAARCVAECATDVLILDLHIPDVPQSTNTFSRYRCGLGQKRQVGTVSQATHVGSPAV